jgi:hypothetical protein
MRNTEKRKSGGSTSYYELPDNAKELGDLINYKNMSHALGEIFCSAYRMKDNGEEKRNIEKIIYYSNKLLDYYNSSHKDQ